MNEHFVVSAPRCAGGCRLDARSGACSYRVAWSINPHMVVGSADPARAVRQHASFVRTLLRNGAQLSTVPFVHGAYDSVFAKDSAILIKDGPCLRAMLAHPLFGERQREQESRRRALEALGFDVRAAPDAPLEGGDVALAPGRACAFLGHGFRSSKRAAKCLEAFLGVPVVALRLRDPALYHLDTALALLRDGTTLVCEEAFTPSSVRRLRAHVDGDVVRVGKDEAVRFGLNLVELGRTVVSGADCPAVANALRARGRNVVVAPLGEFHRAGGSAACLVAPLYPGSVATSPTAAIRSTAA